MLTFNFESLIFIAQIHIISHKYILDNILISEEIIPITAKVDEQEISCLNHMESCPQLVTNLTIALS